ncbi:stage II sporulation protein M [Flagellimonas onchidii]|uniref:stage II sporulation protein M n=1 Tax=Flagellimonas onchidii TaxID=2562684 RepID=UPI0010A6B61F|nr:stage II sporulation protein M [Allomuricauda onchidii]
MKERKFFICVGIAFWLIGALSSTLSYNLPKKQDDLNPNTSNKPTDKIVIFEQEHNYQNILLTNLQVGLLISIGGLLSGGIISAIIFVWNGYILSEIINNCISLEMPYSKILYGLLHSPTEIISLLLFGSIGFKGFTILKTILKGEMLILSLLPKLSSFFLPIILLVFSAIIETNL